MCRPRGRRGDNRCELPNRAREPGHAGPPARHVEHILRCECNVLHHCGRRYAAAPATASGERPILGLCERPIWRASPRHPTLARRQQERRIATALCADVETRDLAQCWFARDASADIAGAPPAYREACLITGVPDVEGIRSHDARDVRGGIGLVDLGNSGGSVLRDVAFIGVMITLLVTLLRSQMTSSSEALGKQIELSHAARRCGLLRYCMCLIATARLDVGRALRGAIADLQSRSQNKPPGRPGRSRHG